MENNDLAQLQVTGNNPSKPEKRNSNKLIIWTV